MWRILAIIVMIMLAASYAAYAQFWMGEASISAILFTPAWQSVKICCGGQLNGFSAVAPDGTLVGYTNTYGAYLYRATGTCAGAATGGWGSSYGAPCWEQLVTATSIPSPSTVFDPGVFDVQVCPGNTSDAYMLWNKALWVTTNLQSSSRTWAQLPTVAYSASPNMGVGAGMGYYIACDPNNANIAYVGVASNTYKITNGLSGAGATVAAISGIGTIGSSPDLIVIDPKSATSGGISQHFFVLTQGTGVYETYNGGTSFALTGGGPTTAYRMKADQFSQIWIQNGGSTISKYVPNGSAGGGTWSATSPAGTTSNQVAVFTFDPSSSSSATLRLIAANFDGNIVVSNNGGSTWCTASTPSVAASGAQPAWMGIANQGQYNATLNLNAVDFQIDPSGNLFAAAGIGVWEITPSLGCGPSWAANSVGIEQLVGLSVISAPGNSPMVNVWDRGFFLSKNPDVFPSTYWPGSTSSTIYGNMSPIEAGWAIDYCSGTPNCFTGWVASNAFGNLAPVSSIDGGNTWTVWPTVPAVTNNGGAIAALSSTNWLTIAGCDGCDGGGVTVPSRTTNAAASWVSSTMPSYNQPVVGYIGVGFPLAADRSAAGTYCLVDAGSGAASSQQIFASTDSGGSFSKVANAGAVDGIPFTHMLISVPGESGHFFYSANSAGAHLWKSTNTCASWTDLNSNLNGLQGFGFGAAKPGGGGYPAIYAYGSYGSITGMYESDDGGSTWALINAPSGAQTWPSNSVDFIKYVAGDPNVYGRIYVAFNGSGFAYIDTQHACPWVNFSNTNPNAALTGTVMLTAQHSGLVPVSSVQFSVDGTNIGTAQTGAGPYSVSWVTGSVATGAHTLKVAATGNGCSGSFSIPITTSFMMVRDLDPASNDNTPAWLDQAA